MPVMVQITAGQPVYYSLNNGLTQTEFEPGEIYRLPEFAAYGMEHAGWARRVTPEEVELFLKKAEKSPTDLPPFIEPKRGTSDGSTS